MASLGSRLAVFDQDGTEVARLSLLLNAPDAPSMANMLHKSERSGAVGFLRSVFPFHP